MSLFPSALALLVAAAPLAAQQPVFKATLSDLPADTRFGTAVDCAGDVNRDGHSDVIVGAPSASTGQGAFTVFSGADQSVLLHVEGGLVQLGLEVAGIGDVDGDGWADVAAGAPQAAAGAGRVVVHSGRTGQRLASIPGDATGWKWGLRIAGEGDVDGDGLDDLFVASPEASPNGAESGAARVYSARTGAVLHDFAGQAPGDRLGSAIAFAGDYDRDGHADLLIGAEGESVNGVRRGTVRLVSGATGAILLELYGKQQLTGFGTAIDARFDLDRDGVGDIAVGEPGFLSGSRWTGAVHFFSGASGARLNTVVNTNRYDYGPYGQDFAVIGDLDQDLVPDVVVASLYRPHVLSGRGDRILFDIPTNGGPNFGWGIESIDDFDRDGIADFVISDPGNGYGQGEIAQIWSSDLPPVYELALDLPPTLTAGSPATIRVSDAPPGGQVSLCVSPQRGIGRVPGLGNLLLHAPTTVASRLALSDGTATFSGKVGPGYAGEALWFQAIAFGRTTSAPAFRVIQ